MGKVVVSEFLTLDGVMEEPQWTFQFGRSDDHLQFKGAELTASDALLLGRRTYQEFATAWPTMQGTGEYGERMNSLPKFVVSTTLRELEWNARLIKDNIAEAVSSLKQEVARDILIFDLVHTLMQENLIDEYRLMVFPVVLGSGKQLFRDGGPKQIVSHVETKTFSSGVVLLTYRPAYMRTKSTPKHDRYDRLCLDRLSSATTAEGLGPMRM
jgi:dihydrofolate reductase